jgi:hypothetical protein
MSADDLPRFQWSQSLIAQPVELVRQVREQGCAVVSSVFSAQEIETMRSTVREHLTTSGSRFSLGKTQPNAAIVVPDLGWIFAHPRVVSLFQALIGSPSPVFTGHCDIHMNMLSGWHRDSGEAFGSYFTGDYFSDDECRVYKMAIYLQDTEEGDSLKVVPHAHRVPQFDSSKGHPLFTSVGDVVIFDVRLPHTGQLPDMVEKGIKAINIAMKGRDRTVEDSPIATRLKQAYCRLVGREDRLSIFFTYGADNRRTEEFARANMDRQNRQANVQETSLPGPLVESLISRGVKVAAVY